MSALPSAARLTATSTITDRALAVSADRVRHAAEAMARPLRDDDDLVVAWIGDRGMFTNVGYVLGAPERWDDVVARTDETVPAGRPVALISAVTVPDLSSLGWQLVGHPPLMVRAAERPTPVAPAELTISEVRDEAGLEVWERTLVDGYPDPTLQPYQWGRVNDARVLGGPTRFFTGSVAGRPVAASAGHVAAGLNLVEMVATAEPARGHGYGAAVTAMAATIDPTLPSVLIASDLGRPVYERLGFVAVSRWTFWLRPG